MTINQARRGLLCALPKQEDVTAGEDEETEPPVRERPTRKDRHSDDGEQDERRANVVADLNEPVPSGEGCLADETESTAHAPSRAREAACVVPRRLLKIRASFLRGVLHADDDEPLGIELCRGGVYLLVRESSRPLTSYVLGHGFCGYSPFSSPFSQSAVPRACANPHGS